MKPFTAIFFAACIVTLHPPSALAQDAAGSVPVPAPIPSDTAPTPAAQPTPPPLFPTETPPPISTKPPHNGGGYSEPGTGESSSKNPPARAIGKSGEPAQNIDDNIAYRKAKTKALRDEKVQGALDEVNAAKNNVDKRAAMKRYYTLLADRMTKIDGTIKKLIATRLKQSLTELYEGKVRPGEVPPQVASGH